MSRNRAGLSLMELLIASGLGVLVILALAQMDVTRLVTAQNVRDNAESYQEGIFALQHMLKGIEGADLAVVPAGSSVLFRVPPASNVQGDLDAAAGYRWEQYRYDAASRSLFFYPDVISAGCGSRQRVTTNLKTVAFAFDDVAAPPPGGETTAADNNVLRIEVTVPEPTTGTAEVLRGQVTIRSSGSTDKISTGLSTIAPLAPAACT